ncbi:MAG: aldo/keto reductase [Oscillospiraceae bacterium]|nr:aldo/keto reductase [Oscillospiraceae bacterium]
MRKIELKRTGVRVSELCFGALPMGPNQKNMSPIDSAEVLSEALRLGVDFVDTAQIYQTYEPIRLAMESTGIRPAIATKSTAASYEDMEAAIAEAYEKTGVDVIDIFLLHAARPRDDIFESRRGAFQCLLDNKQKGRIRAVGISTHNVQTVVQAALNPDVDIVFPILNKTGMGILEGTREDMEKAIGECLNQNKDLYLMKVLAGGNLLDDYKDAIEYARVFSKGKMPIAIGMNSLDEVRINIKCFNDEDIVEEVKHLSKQSKRYFIVPSLCKRCGKCIDACHSEVISPNKDNALFIDESKCLRCGYCVNACPEFAIRII